MLSVKAQGDIHLSQGVFGQAFINPAYAGSNGDLFHATAALRTEMGGFDGAPTTTLINVNGPFASLKGGLSLTIINEQIGNFNLPGFNFGYAFRFPFWEGRLAFGLSAGFTNSNMKASAWRLPDGEGVDGAIPTEDASIINPDFGFGVHFDRDDFFAGLSFTHLNTVKVTKTEKASSLPRVLYLTGGYRYSFENPAFVFLPSVFISTDFAVAKYTLNGHLLYKNRIIAGLSYRYKEAVVLMFGFELFKDIKVNYSYDFITSKARVGGGGAHEVFLSYSFSVAIDRRKQQYRSVRYL